MTDNEIIKALECCIKEDDCENCPYFASGLFECGEHFNEDVLNLINRQQAEIERLRNDLAKEFVCFVGSPHKVESCPFFDELENERAEAVKEFAERYERYLLSQLTSASLDKKEWINFCLEYLDNLKKEMVGDTE